ncbi:MAG: polysaccharide biosynthesis C-terminal domain-containing protein, partial [Rhodobacteraceae bacterium]|nr:polysaccharide biosynthesis C-terminal domain-containing protein [Paracoccaceae bacterium]
HKVLQPLYYAREDSRSPFRYAVVSMVVNAGLALGLMPLIGFAAAAWATTISGWIMVAQLWWGSRRIGPEAQLDARLRQRLPRIAAACAVMGGVLWLGAQLLAEGLVSPGWRYGALALLVGAGMVSYFGTAMALGAFRLSDLRGMRRRG